MDRQRGKGQAERNCEPDLAIDDAQDREGVRAAGCGVRGVGVCVCVPGMCRHGHGQQVHRLPVAHNRM